MSVENEGPKIEVEQVERGTSEDSGRWLFKWRVRNHDRKQPMSLLSVRVPHGKFKAEERKFGPPVEIGSARPVSILDLAVACEEPPEYHSRKCILDSACELAGKSVEIFCATTDNG